MNLKLPLGTNISSRGYRASYNLINAFSIDALPLMYPRSDSRLTSFISAISAYYRREECKQNGPIECCMPVLNEQLDSLAICFEWLSFDAMDGEYRLMNSDPSAYELCNLAFKKPRI